MKTSSRKSLVLKKNTYMRAFGRGVTRSKLQIVSERDDHLMKIEGQCKDLKDKMQHMEQLIVSLMKNQNTSTQSEEQSNVNVQSNSHVHSTQSVKNHTFGSKCKILDWIGSGEIIAEGYFISSDPKDEVHHVPFGPSDMKVGIDFMTDKGDDNEQQQGRGKTRIS
ncbi:uncharacterized protein LOC133815529 [Humulus lupulus]|uniref:uncharacterized protein LOC133815529 n=1 Tax=Humulus lupulus TaxID=3486 RepID=UPI002B41779B|nr:uncharacterized protein LOC133815529 [Humulus lupulus]